VPRAAGQAQFEVMASNLAVGGANKALAPWVYIESGGKRVANWRDLTPIDEGNYTILRRKVWFDVDFNAFTIYTYRQAFPNAEKVSKDLRWLLLKRSSDFKLTYRPVYVNEFHLQYGDWWLKTMSAPGWRGDVAMSVAVRDLTPPVITLEGQNIQLTTDRFYATIDDAYITESRGYEVGQYEDHYVSQTTGGGLASVGGFEVEDVSPVTSLCGDGAQAAKDRIASLKIGQAPVDPYTTTETLQQALHAAPTEGRGVYAGSGKLSVPIHLQPSVTREVQHCALVVCDGMNVDTDDSVFSPAGVSGSPLTRVHEFDRTIGWHVQNVATSFTIRIEAILYAYIEIQPIDDGRPALAEPDLGLGDVYWNDDDVVGDTGGTAGLGASWWNEVWEGWSNWWVQYWWIVVLVVAGIAVAYMFVKSAPLLLAYRAGRQR